MTDKLKTLLHERATSADFDLPDLDAIVRTGDRQVRRRRGLTLIGGIAAAAVVGGVAFVSLGGENVHEQVAVEPPAPAEVSWIFGSTLHTSSGETDLGHEVRAYVRTADGIVFSDTDGKVWSYRAGQVAFWGQTDTRHPRLVSDDEGHLAGWVDGADERPAFVVQDVSTGQRWRFAANMPTYPGESEAGEQPARFYAIDDRTAYWHDARGPVSVDLDSGETSELAGLKEGSGISDVENDLLAWDTDRGTAIGRADGTVARHLDAVYGNIGAFSPDGRYFSSDADEPQVHDVASGERIDFDLGGRGFATAYEWLDARTVVMLAADRPRDDAVAELLTCTVPDGACEFVTELGPFEDIAGTLALPFGESTAD